MKWYASFLIISMLFLPACGTSKSPDESTITQLPTQAATSSQAPLPVEIVPTKLLEATEVITTSADLDTEEVVFRVEGLLESNAELFEFVEVEEINGSEWESLVNPSAEYRAFHLCEPPCGVFIEDLFSGKIYKLSMPYFEPYRNFKDLFWSSTYVLEFKQVTSPDIAVGYAIDVKKRELLDIVHYTTP